MMSTITASSREKEETLTGVVERITYHAPDSGYTVAKMQVKGWRDLLTIIGNFPNIQAGMTLTVNGHWHDHPKHGQQFQVKNYTESKPATLTGMEKYLGSGLIKGVGPVTARRIVAHFQLETLDIIENQIERLAEVPGIGKKRVKMIQDTWSEQKLIKDVMIFLQGHGVSTTYAVKIFKQYGNNAISMVSENPYQLAIDIFGIGFHTANQIAIQVGISPWSKYRYKSGVLHILSQAADEGHCFLPLPELVNQADELLSFDGFDADRETVTRSIKEMVESEELKVEVAEGEMWLCYKPTFYYTEANLAKLLRLHLEKPVKVDRERVENWIERYTKSKGISLSPQQTEAVIKAVSSQVMLLTGGPGCGKTFTQKTLVALWQAMGKKIGLAAPTGRAAQRLGEMAGLEAKTIHRLLEFDPKKMGFKRDKDNPLPFDAVIVDEASMVDLFLAHSLVKAISPDCQLLLVGDCDQLESVGPGKVLNDLLESGKIPVVKLTQVFRQAATSAIIKNAHQINQGQYQKLEPISDQPQSDCLWHSGGHEPEHSVEAISQLLTDFIPNQGFDPRNDVQVLSPMTRGLVGTRNLNQVLQQLLNPPSPDKSEVTAMGKTIRVSDRIIQLKNDYNRDIYNGDLGIVKAINNIDKSVTIQVNERDVEYDFADLNEVALAWSISIHKSQGSEYPVVIMPISKSHYVMLSRNLIYTGLTRAKKLAIILGDSKTIAIAVNQGHRRQRYTRLVERLENFQKLVD
ncbi:SF1B family DNA helicase RecD2 [Crocosphaera watsonii]|uniref:ATP-dependent RecD2 DNA helicase n=3 Tax=Crocosphaera watsonii TaxID=263511 RepID=G5JDD7_CROWT|nr:ATP-dependent RecD-like DNA helicase [Crocosphaera watsonii]EHJ09798.1 Helicase RecD/TraA [Crocosphaera watsonii WH 0003]CCQ57057.1 RecD-like DNA helicase YrrC [Crocosphaera watsonii WH 0005]